MRFTVSCVPLVKHVEGSQKYFLFRCLSDNLCFQHKRRNIACNLFAISVSVQNVCTYYTFI